MAVFISPADVQKLLSVEECIDVLEDLFQQEAKGLVETLPRNRVRLEGKRTSNLMGGVILGSQAYGTRHATVSLLYNTQTGELDAVLDPRSVAPIRTGAATGIATKYMARADASVAGIFGSGRQAMNQLRAICAVRPIKLVKVYSRTPENRESFAKQASDTLGIETLAVASAEECVRGSHVVTAITNSSTPVFDGDWLEPGTHVNAAGSNSWTRCEVDDTTIRRANPVVVDNLEQAKIECGELIWAVERASFRWRDAVELHEVIGGKVSGRPSDDAITLFESQGLGTEDVASYAYVLRKATEQGLGQPLPF